VKNILFASHSASRTGAPLLLLEIATLLAKQGYACSFVLGDFGPLEAEFRKIGPTSVEPLYPSELKYWREIKRIRSRIAFLKSVKPDLFYCNTIHPAKWLLYARMLGIPTVTHVHELGMGFATLTGVEHWLVRKYSGRFIAVSDAVKNYLVAEQGIDAERISVVRAGIRVDEFSSTHSDEAKKSLDIDGSIVIGTVGRITPMKGSDLFLELAARVKAQNIGAAVKFLVVATTDDKEFYNNFRKEINTKMLHDDIVIVENATDVKKYYAAMDIYVSTAREDPFPLVVLEAMASGLPVAAFGVGGIPEMVSPETGILVDALNVGPLADSITELIRSPERRSALGTAARKRMQDQFDLSRNVARITEVIEGAS